MKIDAVFEGGGVKGIGFAGAIYEVEKAGYTFENIAGTSAGAITGALLAVGYSAQEIKDELLSLDYNKFKDSKSIDRYGKVKMRKIAINLFYKYGIYEGKFFEEWLEQLLKAKGKTTFGDLRTGNTEEKYKYKLQVIATDITDQRMLVLPHDLKSFGFDPDKFSIARAVRMSMGIPLFFEPVKLEDINGNKHLIIDGGILSNYPIWLLDDNTKNPPWPTFGFKLIEPVKREVKKAKYNPIKNSIGYFKSVFSTMLEAHDNLHISNSKGDYQRTIGIPTHGIVDGDEKEIKTTSFDITNKESLMLYKNGEIHAREFLEAWNFEEWKEKYRK